MGDLGVDPVRPVVVEDSVVRRIAEGVGGGGRGRGAGRPVQAVRLDVREDGAVDFGEGVGVGEVAAQVGGEALEVVYAVGFYDGLDLGPGLRDEGGVGGREDGDVFEGLGEEEGWACGGVEGGGQVGVPVGEGGC